MTLIFGPDVEQWLRIKLPQLKGEFQAIGWERGGAMVVAVGYSNFNGCDIEMSIYAERGQWAKPGVLKAMFDYPFNQVGCQRVTAVIAKANRKARKLVEHVGFTHEGTHPRALDGKTALSYGLLKENCRWIHG